jgi:hypothetical protein
MPHEKAVLSLLNPEEFSKNYNTRWASTNLDEGSSRVTPELDGSAGVYTAPKTFQEGADVLQMQGGMSNVRPGSGGGNNWYSGQDFGGGTPGGDPGVPPSVSGKRIPGLRTEAEQYADTIAQRGTRDWGMAVRDYVLKGNGPTAVSGKDFLQDQRLGTSERNTDVRAGVSERNNVRTTSTSRANTLTRDGTSRRGQDIRSGDTRRGQDLQAETTRGSHSYRNGGGRGRGGAGGAATARGPNGETITWNGKNWVDARGKVVG